MNNQRTLKQYILKSWLIAGGIAFAASIVLFLGLGYYNYNKSVERAETELIEKTVKAARRLSAELLIAPRGAPEAVRLQLQKELNVESFELTDAQKPLAKISNHIQVVVSVPQLENQYKLVASIKSDSALTHFNFILLISCFAIIGFIAAIGLWLQIKYLNRHIIRPIEALVQTSTGDKNICDHWPVEIQEISEKLSQSFKERDQVIYSQVARGVIHDIRTLLQSLQVATDLASEKQSEARLQNLLAVSQAKLPSLLGIITTALDGSREITVNPKQHNLIQTLQKSIDTTKAIALSKNIQIQFIDQPETAMIAHDPIQLERVFTNILKNAVEAVDDKNKSEKIVRVQLNQQNNSMATIAIEDNGQGLPKNPENVFRLLKSTKAHGSGLGLLVSKKIVEAHGGQLKADHSKNLKGAKFEIQIPVRQNSEVSL